LNIELKQVIIIYIRNIIKILKKYFLEKTLEVWKNEEI